MSLSQARQCRKCNKLYMPTSSSPYCPACVHRLDDLLTMVREFLYDNPTASMEELLAIDEEIKPGDIERWLREGRLLIAKGSSLLKCGRCGKPISGGRVCPACSQAVNSMYPTPDKSAFQTAEDRTGKMRVGDRK